MSRTNKGIRLYARKRGIWTIIDGAREISTGTRDRGEAEAALARHIAMRDRPTGPSDPSQFTVSEALTIYGDERAPLTHAPDRIAYAIQRLVPFLGSLPLSALNGAVCRRYDKERDKAPATVRKELGVLQAAINHCHVEGYVTAAPRVRMPPKPAPRDRWLTRDEVAALLRSARRNPRARHLCRFILIAVYTGTRTEAILNLRFMASTEGGWIDTEKELMYRRGAGQLESRKRTPTIPLPRQLLAHMRRWERNGAMYAVEVDGQRVAGIKTSWTTALRESGIDHCTKHDLRHTAITWAMQRGVERWEASGYFGLSLEMLERVYAHHHPDFMRGAVAAMERRAPAKLGHVRD